MITKEHGARLFGVISAAAVCNAGCGARVGGTDDAPATAQTNTSTSPQVDLATGGFPGVPLPYGTGGRTPLASTVGLGGAISTGSTGGNATCNGLRIPAVTGVLSVTSGYVTVATLHGYGYTFKGSASNATTCIVPVCGVTGCTPAFGSSSLCAAGIVTADTTYNSVVGVGFNLSQSTAGDSPAPVAAPATLIVDATIFSPSSGDSVRVQIVDASGNTFCIKEGTWASGFAIPIVQFNTACWNDSGTALVAGASITSIQLIVVADATTDRTFSFCLTNVVFS